MRDPRLADRLLQGKIGRRRPGRASPSWSPPAGRGRATWWRRWSSWPAGPCSGWPRARSRRIAACARRRVEDELFRFGRILDREPELGSLLADEGAPADKRVGLLREVLGGRVSPVTATLLEQTVRTPRGRSLDRAAEELSELAAARRDRYVAHVRTAVRLSPDQEQRLADSLARLYGRPISLQIELDRDLLGGLVVRVGGELIDGSVAGKLAAARRTLPG